MSEPRRVTIVGVGLIGGSIGLALKSKWPQINITGFDIDPEVLGLALEDGVIDEAAPDVGAGCADADFVFIAVPVSKIPDILRIVAKTAGPKTIVTDVGSTKAHIVEVARTVLPSAINFIGGHPMAGSEQEGLRAATAGLFSEAVYVLTPTELTDPGAFQRLHSLLTKLGARVMALSPRKHDEVVAAVSHLPHLTATTLVNMVATVEEEVENRLIFAAGGFRDLTRIASGNPALWVEICLDNQKAIAASIDRFIAAMTEIRDLVAGGDRAGLAVRLEAAKDRRASMLSSEPSQAVYREIEVPVKDEPGAISQITLTFGQLGLNIEDIQIIHLSGERGVVRLLVNDDPNVDKAMAKLKEYGFAVGE